MLRRPQLQSEAAECGLACLAMLSSAYGLRIDLAELRQRFSISLKGANLAQLIRHASATLELGEKNQLQPPRMLHGDLNHFVVPTKVRSGRSAGDGKISYLDSVVDSF